MPRGRPGLSEVRLFGDVWPCGAVCSYDMKKTRSARGRRARRKKVLAGVGGALVLVVGLAFLASDGDSSADASDTPDVTISYFDGSSEQLSALVGQPVVLNFWASWCPACISEMPDFAEVHRKLGDQVKFVGVNMQEVDPDAAKDLVARTGVEYELAHDPNGLIFNAFGGLAMPTTVFIRADGSVASVHSGTIFADQLSTLIEDDLLG